MTDPNQIAQGSKEWKKLRKRAQTDLYWFNAKVLGHEKLGEFQMTYRAHYALCRFAERRTGIPEIDNSRVQLIQVGRGWGKSLLVTKGRTAQRIVTDPNWAAGILSESQAGAQDFLASIKKEFEENEFLNFLFPEILGDDPEKFMRDTVWAADKIVTKRTKANPVNPTVLAKGVDAVVTRVHMNEWICDDLISEDLARNMKAGLSTEVEKVNDKVVRIQPLLVHPKRSPLTFIGTPWYPGDTYDFIEDLFGRGEKPTTYKWIVKLPGGERQIVELIQKGELAIFRFKPRQDGVCIFPEMFDNDTLDKLFEDDPVFASAQYDLNPISEGLATFKYDYLQPYEWEGPYQIRFRGTENRIKYENVRNLTTILSVDPAQSKKESAARTALVVVGSNGERLFLLESFADRIKPMDTGYKILEFYRKYRPTRIVIEDVAYQVALADILTLIGNQEGIQFPVYTFKPGPDLKKTGRIESLEPYFRKGLFHWDPRSQKNFRDEYVAFSPDVKGSTVDILDALAMQKESWERLSFLRGTEENLFKDRWKQAEQGKINKIRDHFKRRTRVYDR